MGRKPIRCSWHKPGFKSSRSAWTATAHTTLSSVGPDAKLHAGHTTQEEDVVSNWLLTHTHNAGLAGVVTAHTPERQRCCDREFADTIAGRWGFVESGTHVTRQGIDYRKAPASAYLDAWTVTGVHLSAKVQGAFDHAQQYPTTLCFVAGPNAGASASATGSTARTLNSHAQAKYGVFRSAVKCALTAGLRAMAEEGCTVALLAGVSVGLYAVRLSAPPHRSHIRRDFQTIVGEILADADLGLGTAFDDVVYTTLQ